MTEAAGADPAPAAGAAPRRTRWSLQSRLMVTVIGMVALILTLVAVATSALLGNILDTNLNARLVSAGSSLRGGPTAADVLDAGRQPQGFLFVMQNSEGLSGAYVDSAEAVVTLSEDQLEELVAQIDHPGTATVEVDGLGRYRVIVDTSPGGNAALVGLPTSEVSSTLGQILTTVALVTTGGLLLLGIAIALVIRASLRPLRSVADTATRVARMPMAEGDVTISERVPDAYTDDRTEIGQVGSALNTLLDHVDESLSARQRNEELMRRFVADASHELRTPLASIRGYSELSLRALQRGATPEVAETTESALERIQTQSLRMTTLVEDLLLLARLDEGQELVFGSVDLTALAVETVADAQVAGPGHRWHLDVEDHPVVVAGDAARLHQVVANLLANARTHTPEGTTVTVSVHRDGHDAVIAVHDDGPGIDEAIKDDLFVRFTRADRSRARKTGGTGLGLSIARAIAEAHGGTITAESEPGDTTFTVRLPARPADPAAATSTPEAPAVEPEAEAVDTAADESAQ
ncbi:sensor histidine kinase [Microbacterium thalassium]|uniref:histidine kinase n=2 Tax=Microbacterium thalassium TaxID=362649 RepID=A0A7X0KVN5_9MICO|nr:ATP-binding protein [Microbacterium thalassium]MBB6392431.1 two-component system OmpR family sensor kinase [Microbacterium thalassium]GLK25036.1 two-component sensor histidine kinase [Microbacterium thalassium]